MKFYRMGLIVLIMAVISTGFILGSSEMVSATETYSEDITLATDNSTFSDTVEEIISSLFSWIPKTINVLVEILLTPLKALGTIWTNWANTMSGWAGPIIAAFVIIVILVMVRLYSGFDDLLDMGLDWISPGNE